MSTELIVLKKLSLHSHFFIQKKKVALAPKKPTQDNFTQQSQGEERTAESVLHPIERKQFAHTSHIQVRKSNWSSFLDNHYKSRYVYHGYCIPSSANSRSTKFKSRIFKSFCVMYDEQTINRMILQKQLNPSQDHPTLGFRVSRNHGFRVL
jgi:hypothetical protein